MEVVTFLSFGGFFMWS